MPELPEVETVRVQLDARLSNSRISNIEIWKSGREKPIGKKFVEALKGKRIERIQRRAKLLVWKFTDGTAMTAHLKMTGKFVFVDNAYQPNKHDRMRFMFTNGEYLIWNDVRQFGFVHVVSEKQLEEILSKYGPEPLEADVEELASRLASPKTRTIKAALLNQEVISGVGNIYADEVCFRAGIRPTKKLARINEESRQVIAAELKQLLNEAVAQRGTSANDYVDTEGKQGGFLSLLRVYGRAGEPCVVCKTPITKMVLNQRGTHYCPSCQT